MDPVTSKTSLRLVHERPRLLQRQWQDLVTRTEIEDASPHQLREMRRAFYAGANAYALLVRHESDTADMTLVEALDAEMEGFNADVQAGRA